MLSKSWEDFKKVFPWKAMAVGFLIPKIIFLIGIGRGQLFGGAIIAISWCLVVFAVTHLRDRKINIFAALAVIMILARIVVVLASKSPAMYLMIQAIDAAACALALFVSLIFPRSLIQLFAEESGIVMPDMVRNSPYYDKAWRIITAVWGGVFMLVALMLITLKLSNLGSAAIVDILSGWLPTMVLIAFTVIFPRWYWTRNIGQIPI